MLDAERLHQSPLLGRSVRRGDGRYTVCACVERRLYPRRIDPAQRQEPRSASALAQQPQTPLEPLAFERWTPFALLEGRRNQEDVAASELCRYQILRAMVSTREGRTRQQTFDVARQKAIAWQMDAVRIELERQIHPIGHE